MKLTSSQHILDAWSVHYSLDCICTSNDMSPSHKLQTYMVQAEIRQNMQQILNFGSIMFVYKNNELLVNTPDWIYVHVTRSVE